MVPFPAARRGLAGVAVAVALLTGCGGGGGVGQGSDGANIEPAVLRVGEISLRAEASQTRRLPEAAARAYGVPRSERDVLLVVALREGDDATARSPQGFEITAESRDLLGRRRDIALRPMQAGDLTDHVGTLRVSPPETLRFQVRAAPADGEPMELEFTRDFLP